MQIHEVDFVKGVVKWADLPADGLPEVAFLGRSNVGKSSFINMLVQRKSLVRTSKTPGQTRALNFFRLNGRLYLVDMPGLGYARAPREQREHWTRLIERYLSERSELRLALHLVDSRHAPMAIDEAVMAFMVDSPAQYVVALTKADKLSRNQQAQAVIAMRQVLAEHGLEAAVVATSATTRLGRSEVWQLVTRALASDGDEVVADREPPPLNVTT
jgi:GTP-binding protein